MKNLILLFLLSAALLACKKQKNNPEDPKTKTSHPVYTNHATLIYTSQWDDSTVFYWQNWAQPFLQSGTSANTTLINHVLAFGPNPEDKNNTCTGDPDGNTNRRYWQSSGVCIHTDTLTFTWPAADTLPKLWYFGESMAGPICCTGWGSKIPWMTGGVTLTPNHTTIMRNKWFNYTTQQ